MFASQIPHVRQAVQDKREKRWDDLYTSVKIIEWIEPSIELRMKYANPNRRVKFICNECGTEECLSSETFKYRSKNFVTPCTICSGITTFRSLQEIALANAIKEIVPNVVCNTRSIIKPYEIDIWLPDHNVGIEYCGLYWHSEIHDPENKYRHLNKFQLAEDIDVRLITVFEDQWLHKKPILIDLIKKTISASSLMVCADECDISEIDSELANEFYEESHILGSGNIGISYGLFYNGQLISAMSFFNVNNSSGIQGYELTRFSTQLDTSINGAENRLFEYFRSNNNPSYVIANSDLCWCNGSIYTKLGFSIDFNNNDQLNYWYIDLKKLVRISPDILEPNENDSDEIAKIKESHICDLTKIWGCGSENYIWLKK